VCFVSHFTSCRSYVQYRSYSPNNTISVVFSWFSHSHLIMRSRVTNFLSSVNLLPASTSLSAIFSLTIDRSLFTSSFLLLYIFGHFNNRWDSLPSARKQALWNIRVVLDTSTHPIQSNRHYAGLCQYYYARIVSVSPIFKLFPAKNIVRLSYKPALVKYPAFI